MPDHLPSLPRLIVALDVDSEHTCLELISQLDPSLCRLKIGKELFTALGPSIVEKVQAKGFDVFLDLKFHDIPATVGKALKVAANLGVWMVNVHASGGVRMLDAAKESLALFDQPPLLIAVTVLTSMTDRDLHQCGVALPLSEQVQNLARMAINSGLDGLVCSAQEASLLQNSIAEDVLLVTPGIRLEGTQTQDQRRVMTPKQAIMAGVSYIVVGRPITQAANPLGVCQAITDQLSML